MAVRLLKFNRWRARVKISIIIEMKSTINMIKTKGLNFMIPKA